MTLMRIQAIINPLAILLRRIEQLIDTISPWRSNFFTELKRLQINHFTEASYKKKAFSCVVCGMDMMFIAETTDYKVGQYCRGQWPATPGPAIRGPPYIWKMYELLPATCTTIYLYNGTPYDDAGAILRR